jgi:hypothetical protein
MLGETPPILESSAFAASYNWAKLTVPQGSLDLYKNATEWKKFIFVNVENQNDVNGDGEVNIADVNCVINAICEEGTESPRFDSNHDGEINIADINAILDQILKDYPIPLQ